MASWKNLLRYVSRRSGKDRAYFVGQTQLQILTAVVKLFLKRPDQAQGLVQKVLQAATAENDNPDIRDRAYVYWRLLSNTSDPNAAKNIVLSEKPPITNNIASLPGPLLDQLLNELSTLASVYHKPPEQFIGQGRYGSDAVQKAAIEYVATSQSSVPRMAFNTNFSVQGTKRERARESPCGNRRRSSCLGRYPQGRHQRRKPSRHRL